MNELLRDHVTSAAFVLSLGKTHVAELVRMDLELAAEVHISYQHLGKLHRCDMGARQGLARRGLIVHVWPLNERRYMKRSTDGTGRLVRDLDRQPRPGEMWNITRAGRLVIDLLKECDLYSEYAGALQPLIEAARRQPA